MRLLESFWAGVGESRVASLAVASLAIVPHFDVLEGSLASFGLDTARESNTSLAHSLLRVEKKLSIMALS